MTPKVTTESGDSAPSLPLTLSTQELKLSGDPSTLVAKQSGSAGPPGPTNNSLTLLGISIGIWPARILGILLFLAGLGAWFYIRRLPELTPEQVAAHARDHYKELIVPVTDVAVPTGKVIDVPTLDALAKLAKRYALLIFHWSDDAGDLYFVQDETATYRCLLPRCRSGHR